MSYDWYNWNHEQMTDIIDDNKRFFILEMVENIGWKARNASYQHFLSSKYFQNPDSWRVGGPA